MAGSRFCRGAGGGAGGSEEELAGLEVEGAAELAMLQRRRDSIVILVRA